MKKILRNSDFIEIMNNFNELLDQGLYKKIIYSDWKVLKRFYQEANIVLNWTEFSVGLFNSDDGLFFHKDDNSFGTYLYDIWIPFYEASELSPVDVLASSAKKASDAMKTISTELGKMKEEKSMKNLMKFEFGPVNSVFVKMSIYGLAVKNKEGIYVSYDKTKGEIIDVDVFNFDGSKFLYRMPAPMKDITIGDVVIHNNAPMFVIEKPVHGKTLIVIDPVCGERKEIMLTRSPFGFNFVTKIVNFCGNMFSGMGASEDNPFGNMWMLAMMGENTDMKTLLPMMMMSQKSTDPTSMMMILAIMGDGKSKENDMLSTMMMYQLMNQNFNPAAEHTCFCGGQCGGHNVPMNIPDSVSVTATC